MADQPNWQWCEDLDWGGAPSLPVNQSRPPPAHISDIDVGPAEGDPLGSDAEDEPVEPVGLIEYDSAEDDDNERNFMAIKPWLGALYPPRKFREEPNNPKNLRTNFTETNNNWGTPEVKISLDYIQGYRTRNTRASAHWVDENRVVFFAGSVCIIYKLKEDDQDFYFEHDDDVICIDYHEPSGLVASGSIGARNTVRLCIWDIHTQKTKHIITGFHMFAVTSVWFNPSGNIVASLGLDEHHSVALHCVETGQLLACSQVDKNRVLQVKWNTSSACPDSDANFVTCGVKHIMFWTPADEGRKGAKGGQYYFVAPQELDKRLIWYRGTKCAAVDNVTFTCLDHTPKLTLAGATNGAVYAFDSLSYACQFELKLGKTPVQGMVPLLSEGRTIAVGTKDGWVRFYDIVDREAHPSTLVTAGSGTPAININKLDEATDNESDVLVNSVRSLSYQASTKRLLVGTILSHLYAVSIPLTKNDEKPSSRTLVAAHWGMLSKADGYGEIWGVDAHPTKQHVYSTSMDGTVREWDLDKNKELRRMHLRYPGMCVSASPDGDVVAVGHLNGSFTLVNSDLKKIVWPNTRHRVRRVKDVQFSPNSRYLAVAAEMVVDIYSVVKGDPSKTERGQAFRRSPHARLHELETTNGRIVQRVATCKGHTSYLRHLDWNLASNVIQCTSTGCELLYFSVPDGRRITGAKHLADQQWWSQTCEFGWSVQGIWPRFADGSDINSCGSAHSNELLAITNDSGEVVVYNYPCVGSGMDKFGHIETRPEGIVLKGHSSHVTNCVWSVNDEYLITTGGADLCIFVWKIEYKNKPKFFVDANLVRTLQAQIDAAMDLSGGPRQGASPLATGALPDEILMTDDPEERLRKLQERISQKQRPDEPAMYCNMCRYEYTDLELTTCPRCMMPRKVMRGAEDMTKPKIVKAPPPKRAQRREFVDAFKAQATAADLQPNVTFSVQSAHVLRPTASSAAQARESQRTRRDIETKPKAKTFMGTVRGGVGAPASKARSRVDIESDDSDHDERLIRDAMLKQKYAARGGDGAPAKPAGKNPTKKREKATSGPDFRDI